VCSFLTWAFITFPRTNHDSYSFCCSPKQNSLLFTRSARYDKAAVSALGTNGFAVLFHKTCVYPRNAARIHSALYYWRLLQYDVFGIGIGIGGVRMCSEIRSPLHTLLLPFAAGVETVSPFSIKGADTDCTDRGFSWFFSVPTVKCLSNSSYINYSNIRCEVSDNDSDI
jgi:hypothetical protein